MADSGALRARRARAHKAGDHHLCGRRCAGSVAVTVPAGDAPLDPRAMLEGLARRLDAASQIDPADAAVARVLQSTLLALMGPGESSDDGLAKFYAEFGA